MIGCLFYLQKGEQMTAQELIFWINQLIDSNELWKFYKSKEFRTLQKEVLKEQHNECQICKQRGIITKADTVHHVQFVRTHPELALSKTYTRNGVVYRNLIAVCKSCHNKLHTEKGYVRNTIKVVTGFPGCGKTTYVMQHRLPEEPVFDLDYIVRALALESAMDRNVMAAVANGMLESFVRNCKENNLSAWIIRVAPNTKDMEIFGKAAVVYIDLPFDVDTCRERRRLSDEESNKICERYMVYQSMRNKNTGGERW